MQWVLTVTLLTTVYACDQRNTEQYCNKKLCRLFNGTDYIDYPHIGCGNNGSLSPTCGVAKLVDMTQKRIQLILDLHNMGRNRIALGKVLGYASASAMPIIKWDNELQYLAGLNVRSCNFGHDACRNTNRFEFSGQNIGYIRQSKPIRSVSNRLKFLVSKWFYEYPDANQDIIDFYEPHPEGKKIGHFTLMVGDQVRRVGCAAIKFTNDERLRYRFLLTCNYDYTNIQGGQVYAKGETASDCTYWKSDRYRGLCEWPEDEDDQEEFAERDEDFLDLWSLQNKSND